MLDVVFAVVLYAAFTYADPRLVQIELECKASASISLSIAMRFIGICRNKVQSAVRSKM